MDYRDYRRHDALGLAALIASGEVSAAEVLDAAVARAEAVNGALNAIVRPMYRIARERLADDLSGPFAGVPFLVKDLGQDYAGLVTGGGSRATRAVVAAEHSLVVRRWLDAGLVVFGKTATSEFGSKAVTESVATGVTRNPWDTRHTPGGSSGGAAAAVAAGIVPVAGASDGGGSIRIPAACCGLFGLKPGRGLVPGGPAYAEHLHGAATNGVISRTVRDTAAMLDVLTVPDPGGPYLAARPDATYADLARREPGRLRVGFSTVSPVSGDVHPDAIAAVDDAARLLADLGHDVEPAETGIDGRGLARDFLTMWAAQTAATIAALGARPGDVELDTRLLAAAATRIGSVEYVTTHDHWNTHNRALAAFHERYDLLLTPTIARPPVRVGELATTPWKRAIGTAMLRLGLGGISSRTSVWWDTVMTNLAPYPYTQLANLTGRPAMSVPLYRTGSGLPLGVQFVAPLGGEPTLLALATQLEAARPWADAEPPL